MWAKEITFVVMRPSFSLYLVISLFTISGGLYSQSFSDVAANVGITGAFGQSIFAGGGGISFVDFNQDGRDDLTFCTETGSHLQFYQNTGSGFTLLQPPPIANTSETKQVLWVDFDNDGDLDFFATGFIAPNRLYENTGNMTFSDITAAAGLPVVNEFTYGANFGDYDRDGFLDLYITNYGQSPSGYPNALYHNNGNKTFTDVTNQTGTSNGAKQSFCSAFFDYDNNGTSDLYVSNDRHIWPNALYHVSNDGVFTDSSASSGADIGVLAMNAGIGDYNNDGFLDIYVTNGFLNGSHCYLFHNNGNGTFTDLSAAADVTFNRFGWGGNFFDFDNDADLDLYVCSQHFFDPGINALYINDDGVFTEPLFTTNGLGGADTMHSFVNAIGDYNQDGRLDIAVSHEFFTPAINHLHTLWSNLDDSSGNWVKFDLRGHKSNRDAIGAMLELYCNGNKQIRYTHAANAFLAQNSKLIHFGIGEEDNVDSLRIIWPATHSIDKVEGNAVIINQVNTIEESCRGKTVSLTSDAGVGSLRRVLECANTGDTISFISELDTIYITSSDLEFKRDVFLIGNTDSPIILKSQIPGALTINSGVTVILQNFEIIGCCGVPYAISNAGNLHLFDVNITCSESSPCGKAILNTGVVNVTGECNIE